MTQKDGAVGGSGYAQPYVPTAVAEPEIAVASSSYTQASAPPAYAPGSEVHQASVMKPTTTTEQVQAGTTTTYTTTTVPPPVQQPQTTTTTTVTTQLVNANLGRRPCAYNCPYCKAQMVTRTRNQIDACTIIAVVILLLFFWPLFWLPFCMPGCQATEHYCSNCNRKVGETVGCQ